MGSKESIVSCVRIHWQWARCKQGGMLRAVVIIQVGMAGSGALPKGKHEDVQRGRETEGA